jgi:hypothetical protein
MCQAEKWMILQDGQSLPWIYDGSTARRARSNLTGVDKEIGPGRMGDFGMGRYWYAMTDKRSFRAGDLTGGSSGTAQYNFRDSVLKETENAFLNGGGNFVTPMVAGGISAMRFMAILDTALGQGPLQILTPKTTFSNNSPVDRTQWTSVENPIQTVSNITNGGLSHYGSILVNGDIIFRAIDGIRSHIVARRDMAGWGNTPLSREMNRILVKDDQTLLQYSSAIVFNNKLFMSCSPYRTQHGIVHRGWISMDFDQISSITNKATPIYDGVNIGINLLQFTLGTFNKKERCFAASLNAEQEIEIYEFSKDRKFDRQEQNGPDVRIHWIFETPSFHFGTAIPPERKILKQLNNLTMEVENLTGEVHFKVYYKPDSYPCWILWKEFDECATYKNCDVDSITGCLSNENYKPQHRHRISIVKPTVTCDSKNNRQLDLGYSFQVRVEVTGYVEIKSLVLHAEPKKEQHYGNVVGCG